MKRFATFLLALALALPIYAQDSATTAFGNLISGDTVAVVQSADDTDVAIIVKYIGSGDDATVAVAAGGDITFQQASAADTTLECPVSGALGGIIDVSDTDCDTLGEVVDIINGSADWVAVILDGLRADSSDDTLATLSASQATVTDGLNLLTDTSVALTMTRALTDKRDITHYLGGSNELLVNPFRGERTVNYQFSETTTFASGTSTMQWIAVDPDIRNGSETTTTIWSEAGGATTAKKTVSFQPFGLFGKKDQKLVLRVLNSAAASSATMNAYGTEYEIP